MRSGRFVSVERDPLARTAAVVLASGAMRHAIRGSGGDTIVFDDTYFPVVVSTWFGRASDPAVRAFYEHLGRSVRRAIAEATILVNIVDSGPAEVPTADVRRLISELTTAWENEGAGPDTVCAIVVVESAPIRGVLNVLGWLHPGGMRTVHVASLDRAVSGGLDALRAKGRPLPAGLELGTLTRPPAP